MKEAKGPRASVYKSTPTPTVDAGRPVTRAAQAGVRVLSGFARAASDGFDTISEVIGESETDGERFDGRALRSLLRGTSKFFATAADATEQVYRDLQATCPPREKGGREELDYERLASLVAERLQNPPSSRAHDSNDEES